jgi:hypothetical protein
VGIELVFKGILLATQVFQGGERLFLLQIGLFIKLEETNESFEEHYLG